MSYAQNTDVSVEKSQAELQRMVTKYGATNYGFMTTAGAASIGFTVRDKSVRFDLPLPNKDDKIFRWSRRGRRDDANTYMHWEQACRSRWRALVLCVKAKLEAVECGITTFEQEFLAHFVMPGGRTLGSHIIPQLEDAQQNGRLPSLLMLTGTVGKEGE